MKFISLLTVCFLFTTSIDLLANGWDTHQVKGNIYLDNDINTQFDDADIALENIQVDIYEDVNTDGKFDDGDVKIGSVNTNENGEYNFEVNPSNIVTNSSKIAQSSDDAVQNEPGGIMILDGHTAPGIREIGLRFDNIEIPQGAKIESASLKITMSNDSEDFIEIIVSGEAVDNAETFNHQEYNIGNRVRTDIDYSWYSNIDREAEMEIEIDGIALVIQEIVDRDGWSSGNALTLFIADFDCIMSMFDGGFPAELVINYEEPTINVVNYIIAPVLTDVDPSYNLITNAYKLISISESTETLENFDFVFNLLNVTSNSSIVDVQNSISIYPTITSSTININVTGSETAKLQVKVFSMNGQQVSTASNTPITNGLNEYSVSKLPKGTYVMQIRNESIKHTQKIIIQ